MMLAQVDGWCQKKNWFLPVSPAIIASVQTMGFLKVLVCVCVCVCACVRVCACVHIMCLCYLQYWVSIVSILRMYTYNAQTLLCCIHKLWCLLYSTLQSVLSIRIEYIVVVVTTLQSCFWSQWLYKNIECIFSFDILLVMFAKHMCMCVCVCVCVCVFVCVCVCACVHIMCLCYLQYWVSIVSILRMYTYNAQTLLCCIHKLWCLLYSTLQSVLSIRIEYIVVVVTTLQSCFWSQWLYKNIECIFSFDILLVMFAKHQSIYRPQT